MRLAGGVLVERPCVVAGGGYYLLCCSGKSIRTFSTKTGEPLIVLQGHTADVTSVVPVDTKGVSGKTALVQHVWSSSLDGTLRLWHYGTGSLLKTLRVGHPVESMVIANRLTGGKPHLTAYLSLWWEAREDSPKGRVVMFDLVTGKLLQGHLTQMRKPAMLVKSFAGGLLGFVDGRRLWVAPLSEASQKVFPEKGFSFFYQRPLVTLAFSPSETMVAAGDDVGRVIIWHDIESLVNKPVPETDERAMSDQQLVSDEPLVDTSKEGKDKEVDLVNRVSTFHWHSRALHCLTFTPDGAHLLSGGREGVLVMWQLETGARQYLPRLGDVLLFIISSMGGTKYIIQMGDNSVRWVDLASMTLERAIHGLTPLSGLSTSGSEYVKKAVMKKAAIDPKDGNLVLVTMNAGLQVYDVVKDRHVANIKVAPRNFIPLSTFDKSKKVFVRSLEASLWVTHVAFSNDGASMATVELRSPEEGVGLSTCLKIWERASGVGSSHEFRVNTQIDNPHSGCVSSVEFSPIEDLLVTCSQGDSQGNGGTFKVWIPVGSKNSPAFCWRCRSVAGYRGEDLRAVSFSADGEILAVTAGNSITLWSASSNSLLCVLQSQAVIKRIEFLKDSPFLVVYGEKTGKGSLLEVWNLLTLSLWWACCVPMTAFVTDPKGSQMAILVPIHKKITAKAQSGSEVTKSPVKQVSNELNLGLVVVFTVKEGGVSPVAIWEVQEANGAELLYIPNFGEEGEGKNSQLLMLSPKGESVLWDPLSSTAEREESELESGRESLEEAGRGVSAYEATYGNLPSSNQKSETKTFPAPSLVGKGGPMPWGGLFDGPSHILPPLHRVYQEFAEALLEKLDNSS